MSRLNEGVKLQRIYWAEDQWWRVGDAVKSIAVTMENGQMAGVPWALIEFTDGSNPHLVNLALCEGVELAEEDAY